MVLKLGRVIVVFRNQTIDSVKYCPISPWGRCDEPEFFLMASTGLKKKFMRKLTSLINKLSKSFPNKFMFSTVASCLF